MLKKKMLQTALLGMAMASPLMINNTNKVHADSVQTNIKWQANSLATVQQELRNQNINPDQPITNAKYIVQSGDTLSQIAAATHIDMYHIAAVNHINNLNLIYVGQVLLLNQGNEVATNVQGNGHATAMHVGNTYTLRTPSHSQQVLNNLTHNTNRNGLSSNMTTHTATVNSVTTNKPVNTPVAGATTQNVVKQPVTEVQGSTTTGTTSQVKPVTPVKPSESTSSSSQVSTTKPNATTGTTNQSKPATSLQPSISGSQTKPSSSATSQAKPATSATPSSQGSTASSQAKPVTGSSATSQAKPASQTSASSQVKPATSSSSQGSSATSQAKPVTPTKPSESASAQTSQKPASQTSASSSSSVTSQAKPVSQTPTTSQASQPVSQSSQASQATSTASRPATSQTTNTNYDNGVVNSNGMVNYQNAMNQRGPWDNMSSKTNTNGDSPASDEWFKDHPGARGAYQGYADGSYSKTPIYEGDGIDKHGLTGYQNNERPVFNQSQCDQINQQFQKDTNASQTFGNGITWVSRNYNGQVTGNYEDKIDTPVATPYQNTVSHAAQIDSNVIKQNYNPAAKGTVMANQYAGTSKTPAGSKYVSSYVTQGQGNSVDGCHYNTVHLTFYK